MTVFVAGIHGVGKTFLAKPAAQSLGIRYATASQLIRDGRGRITWDASKLVNEVDQNQRALVTAVARLTQTGGSLLLDGHCVLRVGANKYDRISPAVFRDLMCTSIVLLRNAPYTILDRLVRRGDSSWTEDEVATFDAAELEHASTVANDLKIALHVMSNPSMDEFMTLVRRLIGHIPL